jgi:hypothetical protein
LPLSFRPRRRARPRPRISADEPWHFLNENYLKLKAGYLFPEIARRVKAFCDANPKPPSA